MSRLVRFLIFGLLTALCTGLTFAGGSMPHTADGGAFLHIARSSGEFANLTGGGTWLTSDYPYANTSTLTQFNQDAAIFVTHNVTYTTAAQWQPFGVKYNAKRWEIYNTNDMSISGGEAFNVQVQEPGSSVFVHTTTAENTAGNWSALDHPLLNEDPDAQLSVTPRFNGAYTGHQIGVFYNLNLKRWAVFNQNSAGMAVGLQFNVHVLTNVMTDFEHVASTVVSTSKTQLDHLFLNENPTALIIVTQNWGTGNFGIYNDNPIGVEYDNAAQKWRIINSNGAAMPQNARFFVHIAAIDHEGDGMIANGGFEVGATNKAALAGWNVTAAGTGSRRICTLYNTPSVGITKWPVNTGECMYLLKGEAGQTRLISQKVNIPAISNGQVSLSVTLQAKFANDVKIKAVIKNTDGSKAVLKLPKEHLIGRYEWKPVSGHLLLPPGTTTKSLNLKIIINGTGKLYIDDVYAIVKN